MRESHGVLPRGSSLGNSFLELMHNVDCGLNLDEI
jgi:hypothetical protein